MTAVNSPDGNPTDDGVQVDRGGLEHVAERMAGISRSLAAEGEVLESEFNSLMDRWCGMSANKWGPKFCAWHQDMKGLLAQLEGIAAEVRETARRSVSTGDGSEGADADSADGGESNQVSGRFEVDLDQFDKVLTIMRSFEKSLSQAEAQVTDSLTSIRQTCRSAGAQAVVTRMTDWSEDFRRAQSELYRLRLAGESIAINYRNAFRANSQMLDGL